ncbi:acyl dehydratase [Schinkia azotoformans MEV2011]|uniref:MaoC family protein n=2 Tax=Schinkia azotoformans TaxID=1454 RepID=K6DRX9_SCHAZ|nr:hotdog domain-containing protein [Schinkia azotoformans]EKN63511.1 MaoC family protein [Schinkia azotoformans LMG 9581]KEF37454.1 acyl dehydratase [Schinkia azotoformans MEV2011]MEC1638810.1 MaoC/PaaZ C-terminal domain-containing protein [Schinkia azotoformans]MEC1697726.1 MaoC/PaaZ C-terminal domain-containing protein [Schinkia azotoformans]MEC1715914.1 MaoC/PaaZ C-terminal domain-containing protein [Schinkia azotoformans]
MSLKVGDIIAFERTFTADDVKLFTTVSGDEGTHHVTPDEQGRLVIQGLLTATLPTKVGGDHNVLARTMNFEFLRPVFTGDTIRCEVTIEKFERQDNNRISIMASFQCANQYEKQVLRGSFAGVIL